MELKYDFSNDPIARVFRRNRRKLSCTWRMIEFLRMIYNYDVNGDGDGAVLKEATMAAEMDISLREVQSLKNLALENGWLKQLGRGRASRFRVVPPKGFERDFELFSAPLVKTTGIEGKTSGITTVKLPITENPRVSDTENTRVLELSQKVDQLTNIVTQLATSGMFGYAKTTGIESAKTTGIETNSAVSMRNSADKTLNPEGLAYPYTTYKNKELDKDDDEARARETQEASSSFSFSSSSTTELSPRELAKKHFLPLEWYSVIEPFVQWQTDSTIPGAPLSEKQLVLAIEQTQAKYNGTAEAKFKHICEYNLSKKTGKGFGLQVAEWALPVGKQQKPTEQEHWSVKKHREDIERAKEKQVEKFIQVATYRPPTRTAEREAKLAEAGCTWEQLLTMSKRYPGSRDFDWLVKLLVEEREARALIGKFKGIPKVDVVEAKEEVKPIRTLTREREQELEARRQELLKKAKEAIADERRYAGGVDTGSSLEGPVRSDLHKTCDDTGGVEGGVAGERRMDDVRGMVQGKPRRRKKRSLRKSARVSGQVRGEGRGAENLEGRMGRYGADGGLGCEWGDVVEGCALDSQSDSPVCPSEREKGGGPYQGSHPSPIAT